MLWLALLLLLAGPAAADSGMLLGGVANRQMPLDAITTATAAYSERRLRTAYTANKGIRIVRASDSTQTDIGFTPAGYPDKATETTFCTATTCKTVTFYDQVGSRDLTQATDGNRYTRQAGPGGFNASQATAATQTHVSASNITPATGLVSLSVVANRPAGTGTCQFIRENGANNRLIGTSAVANTWTLIGGTSGTFASNAAAAATWHAGQAVVNGASSVINIDGGTDATGTATGNTTAGAPAIVGAASTTCNQAEAIIWDNVALSAVQRSFVGNGQRIGWGF